MTKDFLNLNKLDKELNDIFKSKTTKQTKQNPQRKQKSKPIMTKENQEQAKKIIKGTGSAFGSLIKKIKNRKINKLEKKYFKTQEKAEALAHEIKLRAGIEDHKTDITRYEKELEIITKEPEETPEDQENNCKCIDLTQEVTTSTGEIICARCGALK